MDGSGNFEGAASLKSCRLPLGTEVKIIASFSKEDDGFGYDGVAVPYRIKYCHTEPNDRLGDSFDGVVGFETVFVEEGRDIFITCYFVMKES